MPPRKSRPLKSLKGRVHRLATGQQFQILVSRSTEQLIVLLFFKSSNPAGLTQKARAHLGQCSKAPELANVEFAEVDVSQPSLQGLAAECGVSSLPSYIILKDGEVAEVLTGQELGSLATVCAELAGQGSNSQPKNGLRLLIVSLVVAGAAFALGGFFQRKKVRAMEESRPFAVRLADVEDKLLKARMMLAFLTGSGLKNHREVQEKQVRYLEAYRENLMRNREIYIDQPSRNKSQARDRTRAKEAISRGKEALQARESAETKSQSVPV